MPTITRNIVQKQQLRKQNKVMSPKAAASEFPREGLGKLYFVQAPQVMLIIKELGKSCINYMTVLLLM